MSVVSGHGRVTESAALLCLSKVLEYVKEQERGQKSALDSGW